MTYQNDAFTLLINDAEMWRQRYFTLLQEIEQIYRSNEVAIVKLEQIHSLLPNNRD